MPSRQPWEPKATTETCEATPAPQEAVESQEATAADKLPLLHPSQALSAWASIEDQGVCLRAEAPGMRRSALAWSRSATSLDPQMLTTNLASALRATWHGAVNEDMPAHRDDLVSAIWLYHEVAAMVGEVDTGRKGDQPL